MVVALSVWSDLPERKMELKVLCLLSMFAVDCLVSAEQCGDLYSGQESRDTRERCCRCVDQNSDCNPDGPTGPYGFDCNEIDSDQFSSPACNLSPPRGTEDDDVLVIDTNLFDLRASENGTKCAAGLQLCCSPVPEGVLARQLAGLEQEMAGLVRLPPHPNLVSYLGIQHGTHTRPGPDVSQLSKHISSLSNF